MALDPKTTAMGGAAVALTGGAVAGGVILSQKGETIGERLGTYALTELSDFNSRWTNKGTSDTLDGVNDGAALKTWCEQKYGESVTSQLLEDNNEEWAEIKKWCTATIKQKLGSVALLVTGNDDSNTDKEDWKIKVKNLEDYEAPETNKPFDLSDINTTKEEVKKETNEEEKWKKLKKWCSYQYSKNFIEGTKNILGLSKKFCVQATIRDALHGTELSKTSEFDVDWNKKLPKAKEENDGIKDTAFKSQINSGEETANRPKLQNWCETQYTKRHNATLEGANSATTILSEVKKWCALTIKEKLDEATTDTKALNVADNQEQENWKKNAKALNDYTEGENKTPLTEELKEIKKTTDSDGNANKDKVREWCKGIHNKGYKGENDVLYKLASQFCRKPAS